MTTPDAGATGPDRLRSDEPATPHPLDNPVWQSLTGPQVGTAERHGLAARYTPDIAPFAGVADEFDTQAWADLARLVGPGNLAVMVGLTGEPERFGWRAEFHIPGVQLVAERPIGVPSPTGDVTLGPADADQMAALVALTEPGPWRDRTVELGGYRGVRDDAGRLIAMAGRRMNPPGHIEISAVCTDPAHRGRGLAGDLVRAVASEIERDGGIAFLHAAATNVGAIRLYRALGFEMRREITFTGLRAPV